MALIGIVPWNHEHAAPVAVDARVDHTSMMSVDSVVYGTADTRIRTALHLP